MALLDDIEAFLGQHDMSATALGASALGDRHFVRQLRMGRRVWPETERKVREFMAAHVVASQGVSIETDAASPGKSGEVSQANQEAA